MIPASLVNVIILVVGILHPAYASFKLIRSKSVDKYVNGWSIYWIIFGAFCGLECLADIIFRWFPLYQEIKLFFVFWLLPSNKNGSAIIYRQLLHPFLTCYETKIDDFLEHIRYKGYHLLMMIVRHCIVFSYRYITELVQRNWPISLTPPSKSQFLALPPIDANEYFLSRPLITELPKTSDDLWEIDEEEIEEAKSTLATSYSQSLTNKRRDTSIRSTKSLRFPVNKETINLRAHSRASH